MALRRFIGWHATQIGYGALALSAAMVVVPATPAAAAPARPDIAVTNIASRSTIIPGTVFTIGVFIQNVGSDTSGPVTVALTGPSSVSAATNFNPGPPWTCTGAASTWICEHAPLAAGEIAAPVNLSFQADTAVPGDVLTFTAAAAPEPGEDSISNNMRQGNIDVIAPGVIRGTLWLDTNRDGQRQPDEPRVSSDTPGMISITASPRTNPDDTVPPRGEGFAETDGTYSMTLEPGNYVLLVQVDRQGFQFTAPDVGDDATDSDLVQFQSAELVRAGLSDLIRLTSGGEVVVDAGLAPVS